MIKLARQRAQRKRLGQTLLVLGLMAGAVAVSVNMNFPSSNKSNLSLHEEPDSPDSSKSTVPDEGNNTTSSGDTNGLMAPTIIEPEGSENKENPDPNQMAKAKIEPEYKTTETAIARAGFSIGINPVNRYLQMDLQSRLQGFYDALRAKDLDQASGFYAPTLTRFFNETHINEKKLKSLLLKAWKRTPEDRHEILWDTFQYSQDHEGNYTLEFYMNYVYRRSHRKAWRTRKIYTMIKMDNNLKIFYMSGD